MRVMGLILSLSLSAPTWAVGGLAMGGTNIGGGLRASEYQQWCQNQMDELKVALEVAHRLLDRRDQNPAQDLVNHWAAVRELKQGLQRAKKDAPTLVGVALGRGSDLFGGASDSKVLNLSDLAATVTALEQYYNFVFNDVFLRLEKNLIPDWLNRIEHSHEHHLEMERQYIQYVAGQLRFLNRGFATVRPNGVPVPKGRGQRAYFLAAEKIVGYARTDLAESTIFRDRFACVARVLNELQVALARENLAPGSSPHYPFALVFQTVQQAERDLTTDVDCPFLRGGRP